MQRNPVRKRTRAKALTDPQPVFVSLVKAGANMTPFLAVKAEVIDGDEDMQVAQKSDDHGIASISFNKEQFASKQDVAAWLDAGGYTDYEIEDHKALFVVKGEDELTEISEVATKDEGITLFVGKRPVEAEKDADETIAEEAESANSVVVSTKDDGEDVQADEELNPVATDEPEAVAAEEVIDILVEKSFDEIVAELIEGKALKAAPEQRAKDSFTMSWVGDLTESIAALVYNADYLDFDETTKGALKTAGTAMLTALTAVAAQTVAQLDAMINETEAEKAEVETTEEVKAEEPAAPAVDEISALKAMVESLAAQVQKLASPQVETETPVTSLDETRQTRKSAEVEGEQEEVETKKSDDSEYVRQLRIKNTLGI